jgi:uncharacterized protein YqgC (DUF456 family)
MRTAAGVVLLVAGAIGTVLPLVPGFPLLVAGLAVLGPRHRLSRALARRWRAWTGKEKPAR